MVLRALLLPGEEVGHGGEGGGGHPDVASAGHFPVDDVGAGFLTGFDHVAGLGDGDGTVVAAVDDVRGDVADFGHAGGGSAGGDGAEGGEDIGMVHGDAPGAVAAHGVAHETEIVIFQIDPPV